MINYIWFGILILGIIWGMITGRADIMTQAILASANSTVEIIIKLAGVMCLWCGVMKIAERSGMTEMLAKLLRPILRIIFKKEGRDKDSLGSIVMNITANMMGISNAATPFGIKAMENMQKLNPNKDTASNDMALFLVINAACIQFIPTTVISVRAATGSQNPAEIIITAIITTATAAMVGVISCKILEKYF